MDAISSLVTDTKMHRRIYTDPAVWNLELERIWYRTWVLVGHENEIAKPGDFKTAYLGRKPIILCRGEDGRIRAFLNSCRHRGAMLCRESHGNKKVFQCMYHAWAYRLDGALSSLPKPEAYGGQFDKSAFSLYQIPRVASYCGIIFASLDKDVPPLEEHLGEARKYIDLALGDGANSEVIGIHEYEYRGNWKLHQENTVDGYHPRYLHRFLVHAGIWSEGESVDLGHGHGVVVWKTVKARGESAKLTGLDMSDITPETSRAMSIFPNGVLVHIQDLINLRMITPLAPGRTLVSAIALGIRGEDPEVRARRAVQLSSAQGPAGIAGADDIDLFEAAQEGFAADIEEIAWLDMSRGNDRNSMVGDLEDETAVRGCYREWRRLMAAGEGNGR